MFMALLRHRLCVEYSLLRHCLCVESGLLRHRLCVDNLTPSQSFPYHLALICGLLGAIKRPVASGRTLTSE